MKNWVGEEQRNIITNIWSAEQRNVFSSHLEIEQRVSRQIKKHSQNVGTKST